jgi:hypothetical protein
VGGHFAKSSLDLIDTGTIRLVDHKDVCDFHNTCLVCLNLVPPSRSYHEHDKICHTHHLYLGLANTDGLDEHIVEPGAGEEANHRTRSDREPTEMSPGCHRADIDPVIIDMSLHPYSVAEQRSSGDGTRGVNSQNRHGLADTSKSPNQRIHEGRFAYPGRPGDSHDHRL